MSKMGKLRRANRMGHTPYACNRNYRAPEFGEVTVAQHALLRYRERFGFDQNDVYLTDYLKRKLYHSTILEMNGNEEHRYSKGGLILVCKRTYNGIVIVTVKFNHNRYMEELGKLA